MRRLFLLLRAHHHRLSRDARTLRAKHTTRARLLVSLRALASPRLLASQDGRRSRGKTSTDAPAPIARESSRASASAARVADVVTDVIVVARVVIERPGRRRATMSDARPSWAGKRVARANGQDRPRPLPVRDLDAYVAGLTTEVASRDSRAASAAGGDGKAPRVARWMETKSAPVDVSGRGDAASRAGTGVHVPGGSRTSRSRREGAARGGEGVANYSGQRARARVGGVL